MDDRHINLHATKPRTVNPPTRQPICNPAANGTTETMYSDKLPDCHKYPAVNTTFSTMDQFREFRKFFCHLRNTNFQAYNNNSTALYLCPNYETCHGILHTYRNKEPVLDENGKFLYDRNGYLKYKTMPHVTIGPLTNTCDCAPDHCTSIKNSSKLFQRMLNATNVCRTEFTNLANSYFGITGKDNYIFKSTGCNLTWNCLLCRTGCLQLTMNKNTTTRPSKYQSYGTIKKASPCLADCPSRKCSLAKKTIWLPQSHNAEEMAVTPEQIEHKKQLRENWVKKAREIAQELLKEREIQKKPWKLRYMTEEEIRQRIETRNDQIAQSSRNRPKTPKLQNGHRQSSGTKNKMLQKVKPFQTKTTRYSSKTQKR